MLAAAIIAQTGADWFASAPAKKSSDCAGKIDAATKAEKNSPQSTPILILAGRHSLRFVWLHLSSLARLYRSARSGTTCPPARGSLPKLAPVFVAYKCCQVVYLVLDAIMIYGVIICIIMGDFLMARVAFLQRCVALMQQPAVL